MSQRKGIAKTLMIVFCIIATSLGLFVNKIMTKPTLSEEQLRERGVFLFEKPRLLKDFSLLDHKGAEFSKENLQGKWTLVFFGFTFCPDVCPTTLAMLSKAVPLIEDPEFAETTQVLLVTVDPARDTPEKLAEYVPYFNKNFIGITGEFLTILSLAGNINAAFQKVPLDNGMYTMDHSANVFILNDRGDYQGFMKPPFDSGKFSADYESMRKLYKK